MYIEMERNVECLVSGNQENFGCTTEEYFAAGTQIKIASIQPCKLDANMSDITFPNGRKTSFAIDDFRKVTYTELYPQEITIDGFVYRQ